MLEALDGCVVASYNVYFDLRFLQDELGRVGVRDTPPHLCVMYMRPMLGLGRRCTLADACQHHGVRSERSHYAGADALAASQLWIQYTRVRHERGMRTFQDLARQRSYKFVQSFDQAPLLRRGDAQPRPKLKSRGTSKKCEQHASVGAAASQTSRAREYALHEYWDAVAAVLADLRVDAGEAAYLWSKREAVAITPAKMRYVHARAFAAALDACAADREITDAEVEKLARLHECLVRLGWGFGAAATRTPPTLADSARQTSPVSAANRPALLQRLGRLIS